MVKRSKGRSRILAKMTLSEFKLNWGQILAIIFISMIAVSMFIGFIANSDSLKARYDTLIADSNAADIFVTVDPRLRSDGDMDFIEEVLSGRGRIEGRFYTFCTLNSINALAIVNPYMPTLSQPFEIADRLETQTDGYYFIVDESVASGDAQLVGDKKILLGDTVEVGLDLSAFSLDKELVKYLDMFLLPGAENPFRSGKLVMRFTVTGTMKHIENVSKISFAPGTFLCSSAYFRDALRECLQSSFNDVAVSLIWSEGFHEVVGWGDGDPYGSVYNFPSPDQFLIKLNDGVDPTVVKNEIKAAFAAKPVNNLYRIEMSEETAPVSMLVYDVQQAKQLAWAFPGVFFLVALLIVLVSNRQSILRQRMEIGILKALGFSKREIYIHYVMQTGLVVLIGSIFGEIIGPIAVPLVMDLKYDMMFVLPERTFSFPTLTCLITIVVFVGMSTLMSYLVIRREVNLKPVESLRPATSKVAKRKTRDASPRPVKKKTSIAGITTRLVIRNIVHDPVKALMVVAGVLGCTMLLCCAFGMEDTIDYGVKSDPFIQSGADVSMFFALDQPKSVLEADFDMKDENGVQMVYGYQPYYRNSADVFSDSASYFTIVQIIGDYTLVSGSSDKNHFDYEWNRDTALVSEKVARQLNVQVGDTIRLNWKGEVVAIKVGGTFPAFYDNGVFIHSSNTLFPAPLDQYNALWLDANEGYSNACQERGYALPYVALCDTSSVWNNKLGSTMKSVRSITLVLKLFALALAIIVLLDLGLLTVRERTREVATLKVLGFHKREIAASLLIETLSLTLIGVSGGLALGFPFTKLILYINQIDTIDWLYKIDTSTYFISFGLTFGIAVVINILLMFLIRKVKSVEALKSVE